MRKRISMLFGVLAVVALCAFAPGCNRGEEPKEVAKAGPEKKGTKATTGKKPGATGKKKPPDDLGEKPPKQPGEGAKVVVEKEVPRGDGLLTPDPLDPETPPVVPEVEMTEQHAKTCLLKVGDMLPAGQLPDLAGQPQDLSRLFGAKLTVVVFFREGESAAQTELADLAIGVASPLAARGVNVVGICERGAAATVQEMCKKAGASFPVLIDADGAYFARLATGKMPRTYLVDKTGKILWFDIDYTRDTRHDLREALRALVAK
jgi:peroxiredoxin